MSVTGKPADCPTCGSTFHEIGRVESGEFGPGNPPEDFAIYECDGDHHHEFTSEPEVSR